MKTSVLGLKRSVDLNMNSNIQKDDGLKPLDASRTRRSSKSSKTDDNDTKELKDRSENVLTFTSEDDIFYQPGGILQI